MTGRALFAGGAIFALVTRGIPGLLFFLAVFAVVFGVCVLAHRWWYR